MRFLPSLLVISLAILSVSCKTHDRQQYSYSYRKPVHVVAADKHASHAAPAETAPAGAPALPAAQ